MVALNELVSYANNLLNIEAFQDYAPNGLQVEGRPEINKLVSGVTASMALLEAAINAGADALLVHHGYFWKGEDARVIGMKQRRLHALLSNGMSLLAYHLPLDAHAELGNNARLAAELGFNVKGSFVDAGADAGGPAIAMHGELAAAMEAGCLREHISRKLGREVLHIPGRSDAIRSIGWCSGGAQGYIDQAALLGLDAYLTGEVSEQTTHVARETGIHFFAAGHHATERYGVQALGAHLAQKFNINQNFIDIDNPV